MVDTIVEYANSAVIRAQLKRGLPNTLMATFFNEGIFCAMNDRVYVISTVLGKVVYVNGKGNVAFGPKWCGYSSKILVKLLWELEIVSGDDRHPCRNRGAGMSLISMHNPNLDIES